MEAMTCEVYAYHDPERHVQLQCNKPASFIRRTDTLVTYLCAEHAGRTFQLTGPDGKNKTVGQLHRLLGRSRIHPPAP